MRAAALLLLLSGACAHMQVPPELRDGVLPVEEKPGFFSGNLRFGPFKALDIDKGFTHGGTSSWFGVYSSTEQTQDYSFRFEEPGQPPRLVQCRAAYRGQSTELHLGRNLTVGSNEGRQTLDCKFGPDGAPAPDGILRLADGGPGRLELHETVLEVNLNDEFDNGARSSKPIGYVLTSRGQPVAAVDTNVVGAWMKRDLAPAERTASGLGSAILLLYQPQEPPRR